MKTKVLRLAGVALLLCGISAKAQPAPGTWYLHTDAGGSFIQDTEIKNFFGASVSGVDFQWDPGVRADIAFGYNFTDRLAVELETGVAWNGAKSINDFDLDNIGANVDLFQVPVLINGIYNWQTGTRWTPYFGAGVGGIGSLFDFEIGGGDFEDIDFTFAYQGTAGVKYALSPTAQLDLGYKLLGTLDHKWEDQGTKFETDPTFTHCVVLSLAWSF